MVLRIFRHHLSAPALLLFVLENIVFTGIFIWVMQVGVDARSPGHLQSAAIFQASLVVPTAVLLSLVMWSIGAYDKWHLTDYRRVAGRLAVTFAVIYPILLLTLYWWSSGVSTVALFPACSAAALVAGLGGIFATRVLLMRVADAAKLQRRVLVLGVGQRAAKIAAFVDQRNDRSLEIVGYLRAANEEAEIEPRLILSDAGELQDLIHQLNVEEVVVAIGDRRGVPVQPLLDCRLSGIIITDYLTFWERETGQVLLEALDPSWMIYSDGFRVGRRLNGAVKRLIDIVVSLIFVIFLSPLLVLVALAVRLDSPGPVFYTQERVGRGARVFKIYKFRSMRQDAEKNGVSQWAAENDPRITRIGAFLRKTRIDEIPQVLNVLKGDMSFIGPRPERPMFVDSLNKEIRYYSERARVRPGITGWAQINYPYGASVEDAREKLSYDFYYIKNYSLMLDILVLMATVQVVFFPKGVR